MALSQKLLSENERIILHMHEHVKRLIPNIAAGIVMIVLAVAGFVYMPDSWKPAGTWTLLVLLLVGLVVFVGWPWLKWITDTYTVTNRRIITRRGIFTKTGHDIPLSRISNVAYERDLIDRFFKAGTLELQTSADEPLYLRDVPNAEQVHVMLTNLLFAKDEAAPAVEADQIHPDGASNV